MDVGCCWCDEEAKASEEAVVVRGDVEEPEGVNEDAAVAVVVKKSLPVVFIADEADGDDEV